MIFSQWQPQGGFKYFESNQVHPIGDDLPDVVMPAPSGGIGVPAQDVGYPLPGSARWVGEGSQPRGIMVPMARSGYSSLGQTSSEFGYTDIIVLTSLVAIVSAAIALSSRMGR